MSADVNSDTKELVMRVLGQRDGVRDGVRTAVVMERTKLSHEEVLAALDALRKDGRAVRLSTGAWRRMWRDLDPRRIPSADEFEPSVLAALRRVRKMAGGPDYVPTSSRRGAPVNLPKKRVSADALSDEGGE